MLKIKDEVDLQKLEKFGFVEVTGEHKKAYRVYQKVKSLGGYPNNTEIWNVFSDRVISISIATQSSCDTLYDLIQAGLVEKVGDNQ